MSNEIQLISDGDGIAVIGNEDDVERFLAQEELASSKILGLQRLKSVLAAGSVVAQTGSQLQSGHWVKLTHESAQLVHKYGLRQSSTTGLSTGVINGPQAGQIGGFVQFAHGSIVSNPAVLAGAAGIMAQVAMQQSMSEITDYLETIDQKLDDVLRAQKDTALARMIGVGFVIEEAMTLRDRRGRVDDVTWSKVQTAPATIAETQAYALRQLDALAEKLERNTSMSELAATAKEAEAKVTEWLTVMARCFQLQDAIAVLELDRVLDASPDELDAHRLGLKEARQDRLKHIARSTERLLARMTAAAGTANAKVLLNPIQSPALIRSSNQVAAGVHDFHGLLGIESSRQSSEARRWMEAATQARDTALATGAQGFGVARSLGSETLDRAGSVTGRLSSGIAGRARRWRRGEIEDDDTTD